MRIFKSSRFLVSMIWGVILRIKEFFLILFYMMFIFEHAWRVLPSIESGTMQDDLSLYESITWCANVAFMGYDTTDYGGKEWIVFSIVGLVLNFIMLNYLVSIICIAYDDISDSTLITDLGE